MIEKIINILIKTILINIYFFLFKKNYSLNSKEFNFLNLLFVDKNYLQKLFLSDKYLIEYTTDEKSLAYHSFDWLNIAKSIGGAAHIKRSKKHIFNWHRNYKKKYLYIWNSFFVSKRFINILYNYDFYAISASVEEKKLLDNIILEHYLIIKFETSKIDTNKLTIEETKALLLGSLIYKQDIKKNINKLLNLINLQVDNNGFHKSYNPLQQGEFLNNLYELKNMILFFGIPVPDKLSFEIINMSSLLMGLLHKDGSLPLFNGANNFFNDKINKIIKQTKDIKSKDFKNLNKGIVVYSDNNKKIFMDIVLPSNPAMNKNLHSSTLGFELSCLDEKIITNCGSMEKKISKKLEYLRYSAAHSTIILNNTNISELKNKNSYLRIPKNITFEEREDDEFIVWESSHDGYINNFHKIIKRKISIFKDQNKILGEDSIICTKLKTKKISYSIRFHLMPGFNCLSSNDKKSIIIRTRLNQTWVFKSNSKISIEDSIYLGEGKLVEQNQQIVINGTINNTKKTENWSIVKS